MSSPCRSTRAGIQQWPALPRRPRGAWAGVPPPLRPDVRARHAGAHHPGDGRPRCAARGDLTSAAPAPPGRRHAAAPPARQRRPSIHDAAAMRPASPPAGPTTWTPTGAPDGPTARGRLRHGRWSNVQIRLNAGSPVEARPRGASPTAAGVTSTSTRRNSSAAARRPRSACVRRLERHDDALYLGEAGEFGRELDLRRRRSGAS